MSGEAFASLSDVQTLTGLSYSAAEQERISALLPVVSDALRWEGEKVSVDLDEKAAASSVFANVLMTVTVDVTARVMRQSQTGEAMVQESQTAGPYTWSGTYAVPGGGAQGPALLLRRGGAHRRRRRAGRRSETGDAGHPLLRSDAG